MKPFLFFVLPLLFTLTACDNDDDGVNATLFFSFIDTGFSDATCEVVVITQDNQFFTPTLESQKEVISPMIPSSGFHQVRIDFEPTGELQEKCHSSWFRHDDQYSDQYSHLQIKDTDSTRVIEVKSLRLR